MLWHIRSVAFVLFIFLSTHARAEDTPSRTPPPPSQDEKKDKLLEIAREQVAAAKEAEAKAESQLNEARSGKLIRYGITAGLAIVAMSRSPADGTAGATQRSFNLSTMPYLALAPAYWFYSEGRATFCASHFISGDGAAASAAAFERAKKRARVGLSLEVLKDLESSDPQKKAAAEHILDKEARTIWDPKKNAGCLWSHFGVYVGKPTSYDAIVRPSFDEPEAKREVKPTASAGIVIIPNAYISLLLGVTGASITEPAKPATGNEPAQPETARRFATFTFGVGGNLDLIGGIFN